MNKEETLKKQINETIDFIGIFINLNETRREALRNWLSSSFHIMYLQGEYDGIEKTSKIWQDKE